MCLTFIAECVSFSYSVVGEPLTYTGDYERDMIITQQIPGREGHVQKLTGVRQTSDLCKA